MSFLNNNYYYFKYVNIYIILFLIFFENHFYHDYNYCSTCNNLALNSVKCNECPLRYIFKGLNIISNEKTLDEIIYNHKSLARFGDGEYRIIFGSNAFFQRYNKSLATKLYKVLNSDEKNLLIGINLPWRKKDLEERSTVSQRMWENFFPKYKINISKIINKNKK